MKKNVFALIFLTLILSLSDFSYPEVQENSKKEVVGETNLPAK